MFSIVAENVFVGSELKSGYFHQAPLRHCVKRHVLVKLQQNIVNKKASNKICKSNGHRFCFVFAKTHACFVFPKTHACFVFAKTHATVTVAQGALSCGSYNITFFVCQPERILGSEYSVRSELWSLGVSLLEVGNLLTVLCFVWEGCNLLNAECKYSIQGQRKNTHRGLFCNYDHNNLPFEHFKQFQGQGLGLDLLLLTQYTVVAFYIQHSADYTSRFARLMSLE